MLTETSLGNGSRKKIKESENPPVQTNVKYCCQTPRTVRDNITKFNVDLTAEFNGSEADLSWQKFRVFKILRWMLMEKKFTLKRPQLLALNALKLLNFCKILAMNSCKICDS